MIRRSWRWLTGRVTIRPRRITVAVWLLVFLFDRGIERVLRRYDGPVSLAIWCLIAVLLLGLLGMFAHAWHCGRRARAGG